MDLSRERQCGDKAKHASRTAANVHKFRLVEKGHAIFRLNVYRCDHCNHWHVGHRPIRRRKK